MNTKVIFKGEWDIDSINVTVVSNTTAHITYRKFGSDEKMHHHTRIGFVDFVKGISLEQKVKIELESLIKKLIKDNECASMEKKSLNDLSEKLNCYAKDILDKDIIIYTPKISIDIRV